MSASSIHLVNTNWQTTWIGAVPVPKTVMSFRHGVTRDAFHHHWTRRNLRVLKISRMHLLMGD